MTWTTTETKAGRAVRLVNGERLDEYRLEPLALAEAGEQGWDLVAVVAAGGKQDYTLYFKRLLPEDRPMETESRSQDLVREAEDIEQDVAPGREPGVEGAPTEESSN